MTSIDDTGRGPFSFFWLPVEVRIVIYGHLLCIPGKPANVTNRRPSRKPQPIYTAILRTCQTIYLESIGVLYEDNTFRWNVAKTGRRRVLYIQTRLFLNIDLRCHFKHVQMVIRNSQLEGMSSFSRRIMKEVSCLCHRHRCRILIVVTDLSESSPQLSHPAIQDIRNLTIFKNITIKLADIWPGNAFWSPALIHELESGLGPNLSSNPRYLEFKPGRQSELWITNHVSPLMRIPRDIRLRIIREVVGLNPVEFPVYISGYWGHYALWRVMPSIRRVNPGLDLSMMHVSQKLWEETLYFVVNNVFVTLKFDFSKTLLPHMIVPHLWLGYVYLDEVNLPSTILRVLKNVSFDIKSLKEDSDLDDPRFRTATLLRGLHDYAQDMVYSEGSSPRQTVNIRLSIDAPQWCREPGHVEKPAGRRVVLGDDIVSKTYFWRDYHTRPYINGWYGHDVGIADRLRPLISWDKIVVNLLGDTVHKRYWRASATRYLEETLGPNLSEDEKTLLFRPAYLNYIHQSARLTHKEVFDYMRTRDNLDSCVDYTAYDNVVDKFHEERNRSCDCDPHILFGPHTYECAIVKKLLGNATSEANQVPDHATQDQLARYHQHYGGELPAYTQDEVFETRSRQSATLDHELMEGGSLDAGDPRVDPPRYKRYGQFEFKGRYCDGYCDKCMSV